MTLEDKTMKKFAALLLTLLMTLSLAACAGNREMPETASPDAESRVSGEISALESSGDESSPESGDVRMNETEQTGQESEKDTAVEERKVLVAYFSATNTTEGVA